MAQPDPTAPDTTTPSALAAARLQRKQAIHQVRTERHTEEPTATPTHGTLQESHNDSLHVFKRKNRQEQGTTMDTSEASRGRDRQRRSSARDSSLLGKSLEEVIQSNTPKQSLDETEPHIVDLSDLIPLLEGTVSQGHNGEELIAASPADLLTSLTVNQQLWFDLLTKLGPHVEYLQDGRNHFHKETSRLRNERNELRAAVAQLKTDGKQPAGAANLAHLQQEFEDFRNKTTVTLTERNAELQQLQNAFWDKDDECKLLEQENEELTAECDQAKANLATTLRAYEQANPARHEPVVATQSQTQQHADIFARPVFTRTLAGDRHPSRSRSRAAPAHERAVPAPTHERAAPLTAPSISRRTPGADTTASSSSTKLDPRWPNPDMFNGDSTKYRVWRSKMLAKIRASYGDDGELRTVLDYIQSRTEGQAWQIIENHSESSRLPWTSIDDCWSELNHNYKSKDEEAKADMAFAINRQNDSKSY